MKKLKFMLNWYDNPYHAPIFIAKHLGYYHDVGIDIEILSPKDPSEVTKDIASGKADAGLKAMIHTIAGRARGYPIVSIGTLLDEPQTGLIFLQNSNIKQFSDIKGKKIGYIGEFGKHIIDNLASHINISPDQYETVRVGMYMVEAIKDNKIDAGIGFSSFQQIVLNETVGPASILPIDQLADLGCCCFCSIQIITNDNYLQHNPELLTKLLVATQRASAYITQNIESSWETLIAAKSQFNNTLDKKIFIANLPMFSRTLLHTERDWKKVYRYTQHLKLHAADIPMNKIRVNNLIEKIHTDLKPLANCTICEDNFSDVAWNHTIDIIKQIESHKFVTELTNSTLSEEIFGYYIEQDTLYLKEFSRCCAIMASRTDSTTLIQAFLEHARYAFSTEYETSHKILKEKLHLHTTTGKITSTTLSYTSYLLKTCTIDPIEIGIAALLPCFWIYYHIASSIQHKSLPNNKYAPWINTYSSDEFIEPLNQMKKLFNSMAEESSPTIRKKMLQAFRISSIWELRFWEDSYQLESFDIHPI